MASSSNGNGNLVDEFEESFQACIHALTKHESATGTDKDEISLDVDQTTIKFVDLARQMEAFFIQKRFLLSALKPELVLKEENLDLRYELTRKSDLVLRHYEKIDHWKNLLADLQQGGGGGGGGGSGGGGAGSSGGGTSGGGPGGVGGMSSDMRMGGASGNVSVVGPGGAQQQQQPSQPGQMAMGGVSGGVGGPLGVGGAVGGGRGVGGGMPNAMQAAQLQAEQQHQQHHLQQQQHLLQAQQMQHMQQQMQVGAQQMFIQQQQQQQQGVGTMAARGGFNQAQNVLQGPLAYLEKTTSNIDLVGIGDGRR